MVVDVHCSEDHIWVLSLNGLVVCLEIYAGFTVVVLEVEDQGVAFSGVDDSFERGALW